MTPPAQSVDAIAARQTDARRRKWKAKQAKWRKYAHEHNKDPNWFKHKKHILICSWSGRPVYTRYGDETSMAAYMGVLSAIISNFQNLDDNVRSIVAGKHTFVFQCKGPLYLVAVSSTSESVRQLETQLNFVHQQVLSVLTGSVNDILQNQPSYDLRNLMGGTENLLTDLISESNRLECWDCLHSLTDCPGAGIRPSC